MAVLENIMQNVLFAIYQSLGFSVILAFVAMYAFLYAKEHSEDGKIEWKKAIGSWVNLFRHSVKFRKVFFCVLILSMILFRTLLSRTVWKSPLGNVIGTWGFFDKEGDFTTEAIENIILFIPFTVVVLFAAEEIKKTPGTIVYVLRNSLIASVSFSVFIECAQLFLWVGQFQLSDIAQNIIGGMIGGLVYYIFRKIRPEKK